MPKAKSKRKAIATSRGKNISRARQKSPASTRILRGKELEGAVEQFQSESDDKKAHEQWKKIEASVFGVQFED